MKELTRTQSEFLSLAAKGLTTSEIGEFLHICKDAVTKRRAATLEKLDAKTTPHAIFKAFEAEIFKVVDKDASAPRGLTIDDLRMLSLMAHGKLSYEREKILQISATERLRRERILFDILEVATPAEAVYEACATGLIEVKQ